MIIRIGRLFVVLGALSVCLGLLSGCGEDPSAKQESVDAIGSFTGNIGVLDSGKAASEQNKKDSAGFDFSSSSSDSDGALVAGADGDPEQLVSTSGGKQGRTSQFDGQEGAGNSGTSESSETSSGGTEANEDSHTGVEVPSNAGAKTRGLAGDSDPASAEKAELASRWGFAEVSNVSADLGDPDFATLPGTWKPGEAERVSSVLSKLPADFVQQSVGGAPKIYRAGQIQLKSNPNAKVGGITSPDGWIALPDMVFERSDFEHAVIHEFAHGWALKNPQVEEQWQTAFWASENRFKNPPPPSVPPTRYAQSAFFEDFADSVALYLADPQKFRQSQPERCQFIEKQIVKR